MIRTDAQSMLRIGLFGLVFLGTFLLASCGNHFSWLYHNDESSKVAQVLSGQRNFNHPPLLLSLTDGVVTVCGTEGDPQSTVQVGRMLSALFLALANALLVDLAVTAGGLVTGVALGAVLLVNPALLEVGHYFKEDTLLLLGLSASFWALVFYGERSICRRATLLGAALAVLAASKYVGWFWVLPLAAQAMVWAWRRDRPSLVWLAGVFFTLTVLFYLPALRFFDAWRQAGSLEMSLLISGDYGTGLAVPHGLYLRQLVEEFGWPVLAVGMVMFLLAGRKQWPDGAWLMVATSASLLVVLAWTAKYSDRYLLPVSYLLSFVVVTGPVLVMRRWGEARPPMPGRIFAGWCPSLAALLVAGLLVYRSGPAFVNRFEAFQSDSRTHLREWIASQFHGELVLAEDEMARVEVAPGQGKWTLCWFVADLSTLDELRGQGVTHVLASYDVCHRFVDGSVANVGQTDFNRRANFYRRLFREGVVVWYAPSRQPKALHPGLTLVDIRARHPVEGGEFRPR